jgi:hypothetical protein
MGSLASDSNPFRSFSRDEIEQYTSELETPFDTRVIEWRVTNCNQQKTRGQVIPYADQRAYTDRLNALFTPAGWTRRYTIHTSANFERSKDQKIVAKVLVMCELTIFGVGAHSATGEEWADNENAGTSAEAQAFKRACCCFGLGRYLYYFRGVWVDLDQHRYPRSVPALPKWATRAGWLEGLRPNEPAHYASTELTNDANSKDATLIPEIEAMSEVLGRGLYRGLLRDVARVWNPREIRDRAIKQRVLEHMRSAERGLRRLEVANERVGPQVLSRTLESLGLTHVARIDKLETLKRIIVELEAIAEENR